jgi:hypothetical protein
LRSPGGGDGEVTWDTSLSRVGWSASRRRRAPRPGERHRPGLLAPQVDRTLGVRGRSGQELRAGISGGRSSRPDRCLGSTGRAAGAGRRVAAVEEYRPSMLTCLSPNEGQPGGVLTDDRVTGGPQTRDGGVDVSGVPQHHGVEHQAEHAELVFLAFPVCLPQLAGCRGTQPDPALRRGDHLHARLRPGPGEPLRHLLPRAIQRAGQVPQVLSASQAGEDLGLTASHATPSSSIARGPAHHSHDAANTSRRRGGAGRATAPGRAARKRPGPPPRREGPGCHTPRGRLGRNRLQTLASCGILAYSRQPEIGAQEKIPGQSLRKDSRPRRPPALPASPRARPEPLTSESNGRPEKLAACCRSPDVGVHLENFGAGDLVGAPVPSVRRRPAAGLDDHGSGHILGRGPG